MKKTATATIVALCAIGTGVIIAFTPQEARAEAGCKYQGKDYSPGSEVCIASFYHECRNGQWVKGARECKP